MGTDRVDAAWDDKGEQQLARPQRFGLQDAWIRLTRPGWMRENSACQSTEIWASGCMDQVDTARLDEGEQRLPVHWDLGFRMPGCSMCPLQLGRNMSRFII